MTINHVQAIQRALEVNAICLQKSPDSGIAQSIKGDRVRLQQVMAMLYHVIGQPLLDIMVDQQELN